MINPTIISSFLFLPYPDFCPFSLSQVTKFLQNVQIVQTSSAPSSSIYIYAKYAFLSNMLHKNRWIDNPLGQMHTSNYSVGLMQKYVNPQRSKLLTPKVLISFSNIVSPVSNNIIHVEGSERQRLSTFLAKMRFWYQNYP